MKVPSGCIMCPWVSPQHVGQTVNKDSNCLWQTMNLSTALKTRKGKNTLILTMTFFDTQSETVSINKKVFTLGHWEIPALLVPPQRTRSTSPPLDSMTYHQNGWWYQKMTIHHHFVQDWPVELIFRFESPHPPSEVLPEQLRWKRFILIIVHHCTFISNNTYNLMQPSTKYIFLTLWSS